jgi:sigma-B regulation protein RsbU (phosphoserine phosphatase)
MPTPPHVLLFADDPAADDVRATLAHAGFDLHARPLGEPALANGRPASLLVVDGLRQPAEALKLCQRLRTLQTEQYVPILYVTGDPGPADRVACLERGADTYVVRPFDPPELLAQAQALLRIKDRHDALTARAAEANRVSKRLQETYRQIDQELALARRIQESFLPQALPNLPGVRFAVKYRPCSQVGGDFYDVFRLDEQHLGFYVADAVGHGVPASLLTIYVKKAVRAKEITGQSYRLVPPDEVLEQLNRDMIEQALSDAPFITMAYALFNHADGTLRFSRAGHPHPIYLPAGGPPELWRLDGSLLGVFETQYHVRTERLRPGDKLLFYTDGMDAAAFDDRAVGVPSLLAAADRFRDLPVGELVEHLASDLFTQTKISDDLTVLGLEIV